MHTIGQDLRFAVRMLAKKRGFTTFAVTVLALGISANTSMFSLANVVLLRPLPYRDAGRLVMVWEDSSFIGFPANTPAPANYADWNAQNRSFEGMAAIRDQFMSLTGAGEPVQLRVIAATANLFSVLGVQPALGRAFAAEEDRYGGPQVVILSYGLWKRQFGGDANIVGQEITLDDEKYSVVGIMPRGFRYPQRTTDALIPAQFSSHEYANRRSHYLEVVARLKPNATLAAANAELSAIANRLAKQYPDDNTNIGAYAVPLRDHIVGSLRLAILVLLGAVAFVLLIACANVANLLLARATERRRELAVRMALGAGRAQIVRQLLTESVLLSGFAGAVGILLSAWGVAFLKKLIPLEISQAVGAGLDARVLAFTVGISALTGITFGIVPALRVSGLPVNETLKQAAARGFVGAGGRWTRHALVIAEIALAVVLLSGAGLMIESFLKLRGLDPGFRTDRVLKLETALPRPKYADFSRRTAFYDQVLDRVARLPGVVTAGFTTWLPLTNDGGTRGFTIEGRPQPKPGEVNDANARVVSKDYLRTLGVPLRRGRLLDDRDGAQSMPVALINETMARTYWPKEDSLGWRIKMGDYDSREPWITVVGMVGDMRQSGPDLPARPEMYFPYQQQSFYEPGYLAVKTAGDPMQLAAAIRESIWSVDKQQPVAGIMPLEELIDEDLAPRKLQASLLGGFAGFALLLASLGIYAVLSFSMAQRTQEIGVRMALGAHPRDVLRIVLGEGLRLAVIGVVLGIGAALILTRVLGHLLYGLSTSDPETFVVVAGVLLFVALAACFIPARRAMRLDPMQALHYE